MSIQISNAGTHYTLMVDGVSHGIYRTKGAAQVAAAKLKELDNQ
jgi:hypothetical protein